ncbi:MAG: hypothetical protein DSO07_03095 [Thermoproteota archaeon]|jgi:hypothetical protein|uniref:CooT family nickel-binding protein n=1 Tax=Candidatus Methanodesulfokora washburnensis TaxID=2478471 RepID=A0A429GP70_9CREN|nr:CooT family nickel-binding protein [Candidatus Methanodesulfokores washburnensis]RSN75722.1 CooT family nickel-binding protein [Candidatus Methanodesulfokores washburnensis]RZN62123.1 MAG: CooT family nickel-binding protein [Candidatus Methanodesulfokores washburnensis]TDA41728.1 MAG: hypothetical protein DSO07_03095 [Candidatus Korarchaeota archaeon]
MCEGVAYILNGDKKRILDEVVSVVLSGKKLVLLNEDGVKKEIEGVKELRVDMLRHEVYVVVEG